MSKSSEAVKKWRKVTKQRIVESFDGKCGICDYNKCNESLVLHHTNPEEKNFILGSIRANPKSWNKIVKELRKCVLLCHNCHSEFHAGLIEQNIIDSLPRFNEEYLTYESLIKKQEIEMNNCPVCGKLKPKHNINCSLECAGKAARKVDWDNIDLLKLLKTNTFVNIGEMLDVSDAAVRKRYRKILITSGQHRF